MEDAVQKLLKMLLMDPDKFMASTGDEVPGTFTDMGNAQKNSVLGYSPAMLANLGLDQPSYGYSDNAPLPTSDMTGAMLESTRPPETPTGYQMDEPAFNDMTLPEPSMTAPPPPPGVPAPVTGQPATPVSAIDELRNLFPDAATPAPTPTPTPTPTPAPATAGTGLDGLFGNSNAPKWTDGNGNSSIDLNYRNFMGSNR